MQKPNLIIYESMMEIFEDFYEDGDGDLAIEYMLAIFNYYRTGEIYNGESKEIKRQMKNIYKLIDKQQENFIKKVESTISNEDFIALAQSGDFKTQKELSEYITAHYGSYTPSAVSKRLRTVGITFTKAAPSSQPSPSAEVSSTAPVVEEEVEEVEEVEEEIAVPTEPQPSKRTTSRFI